MSGVGIHRSREAEWWWGAKLVSSSWLSTPVCSGGGGCAVTREEEKAGKWKRFSIGLPRIDASEPGMVHFSHFSTLPNMSLHVAHKNPERRLLALP